MWLLYRLHYGVRSADGREPRPSRPPAPPQKALARTADTTPFFLQILSLLFKFLLFVPRVSCVWCCCQLLSLADLVKDKKANQVKLDAVRLGLTIGGITGVHKLAYGLLARLRRTEDGWNSLISGALSGLPLLFQEKGTPRSLLHSRARASCGESSPPRTRID